MVCNHINPQLAFPSKYTASVISELSCDPSTGCGIDDHVVSSGSGTSVTCSVVPSGNQYDVQLSLNVDGSATNDLSGQFSLNGTVSQTGGMVAIQETNVTAGGGGSDSNCTLTITPSLGLVKPGEIWASFECGALRAQTDIGETGCDLRGQLLFENCAH